jgi:hypothetical protein
MDFGESRNFIGVDVTVGGSEPNIICVVSLQIQQIVLVPGSVPLERFLGMVSDQEQLISSCCYCMG